MSQGYENGYVLGIDLGAHSLGWAALPLDECGQPRSVADAGVRTFEAGVEASYDQMIQGRQKSRAANRREKRMPRRQFWRRAWRRYKILKCLIAHDLLGNPDGRDIRDPTSQDSLLKAVDDDLRQRLRPKPKDDAHLWEQRWLYELRASALERRLDPLELGRALYHLAQRRGFLSNRKTEPTPDDSAAKKKPARTKKAQDAGDESGQSREDPTEVKAAIAQLERDIEAAIPDPNLRTLGYYFARHVNPEQRRIRKRWTSRAMYEKEFDAICDAQASFHPGLARAAEFRRALREAIFNFRPLKPAGHLVGHCDLEQGRKRALQALPVAQEFRLLQRVNDLTVLPPDGGTYSALSPEQRSVLVDALSARGDLTFKQIRKLLGFTEPKVDKQTATIVEPGHQFNLERGGEEKLPGHRTAAKILARDERAPGIAQHWTDMPDRHRDEFVTALIEFEDFDALAHHLQSRFGFSPEQAAELAKVRLEDTRCALSHRALERLVPFMRSGMPFATAKEHVPEYRAKAARMSTPLDFLPRVLATDERHVPSRDGRNPSFMCARDLRNPAVTRALAELRKVVNSLIRRYGKPERIHIELARELKKSPKEREAAAKHNRERQADRERARQQIRDAQVGWSPDSDEDIRKWLLGQEQGWHCPYCGQPMPQGGADLQIDHIIPRGTSLDNGMNNQVLCHADCNLQKGMRAPCDAFDAQQLEKTRAATTRYPIAKRQRFLWSREDIEKYYGDESGGFTRRQLQDTQYASRLARDYLGAVYGGPVDAAGITRVQASSGGVTAVLRAEWGLNAVIPSLPDSPAHRAPSAVRLDEKLRTDHRHHAVDAIVIACASPRTVQLLADAARRVEVAEARRQPIRDAQGRPRRRFDVLDPPWGDRLSFAQTVRNIVAGIVVSRRPERKLQGPLHAETNYSKPISLDGVTHNRQRLPLSALSEKDILRDDVIADPRVRDIIRERWRALGGGNPKDVFANPADHPRMHVSTGALRPTGGPPIHTVRINIPEKPQSVGHGHSQRFVLPGKNTIHHAVVIEETTRRGPRWRVETVTRLDVLRRRRRNEPVVQRKWPAGRLAMWLCKDDCIEMDDSDGARRVFVVRMISKSQASTDIKVRLHCDARTDDDINKSGERSLFRINSADTLRKRHARKVTISPLGEVHSCND